MSTIQHQYITQSNSTIQFSPKKEKKKKKKRRDSTIQIYSTNFC